MASSLSAAKPHPASKLWLRPTLKDVARHAGVARSTVSAILGNRPHCYASQETRQRVLDAAQRLNYQPNALSRALLGQQTYTIGLVLRSLIGPTMKVENIAAIERLAQQQGYRMLVAAHENSTQREANLIRSYLAQHVDGFIVEPAWGEANETLYAKIIQEGMPLVAIDPAAPINAAQVWVDRQHGASLQVKHLIETGRRRFVFMIEAWDHPFGQAKVRGHRKALGEAGIDPDAQIWQKAVYETSASRADCPMTGTQLMNDILASGRKFDAVVTSSDSLALGAMRALFKAGQRVPQDVAIAGFHDEMFGASLPISLTTVRHPPDIDQIVFNLLMNQIGNNDSKEDREGNETQPSTGPRRVVCTPTLVVRESTASQLKGGRVER